MLFINEVIVIQVNELEQYLEAVLRQPFKLYLEPLEQFLEFNFLNQYLPQGTFYFFRQDLIWMQQSLSNFSFLLANFSWENKLPEIFVD